MAFPNYVVDTEIKYFIYKTEPRQYCKPETTIKSFRPKPIS